MEQGVRFYGFTCYLIRSWTMAEFSNNIGGSQRYQPIFFLKNSFFNECSNLCLWCIHEILWESTQYFWYLSWHDSWVNTVTDQVFFSFSESTWNYSWEPSLNQRTSVKQISLANTLCGFLLLQGIMQKWTVFQKKLKSCFQAF